MRVEIEAKNIMRKKVVKSGNRAIITMPTEYIGKEVIVIEEIE